MSDHPFILWKCAASLDGRIAAADGSSKWITSAEARADGHRLRAECGAVMVGSGTQQADDPQLAVRDAEVTRQPLRIVVDSNARARIRAHQRNQVAATPPIPHSPAVPARPSMVGAGPVGWSPPPTCRLGHRHDPPTV